MAKQTRDTLTSEKHEDLFRAYMAVVEKYGNMARLIPKKVLYQEAVDMGAPQFYMTAESAAKVITQKLKEKGK